MRDVTLFEMSPRDGLQNEPNQISTDDKIKLVNLLSDCGFAKIETASFVSPRWVPQMADGRAVLAGIKRRPGTLYTALVPNLQGLENALSSNLSEIAVFASASESFSQKNINCSIAESLERFKPVIGKALEYELPVRGYVSCVTHCPYEGPVAPKSVADVAKRLSQMGCYEISLGDTIGAATPKTVKSMLDVVTSTLSAEILAGHFHDTQNRALENIGIALEYGIRVFDSSVGGLGGCPFAPGAKGNVASEQVAALLKTKGLETGLNSEALARAAEFATSLRGNHA